MARPKGEIPPAATGLCWGFYFVFPGLRSPEMATG